MAKILGQLKPSPETKHSGVQFKPKLPVRKVPGGDSKSQDTRVSVGKRERLLLPEDPPLPPQLQRCCWLGTGRSGGLLAFKGTKRETKYQIKKKTLTLMKQKSKTLRGRRSDLADWQRVLECRPCGDPRRGDGKAHGTAGLGHRAEQGCRQQVTGDVSGAHGAHAGLDTGRTGILPSMLCLFGSDLGRGVGKEEMK